MSLKSTAPATRLYSHIPILFSVCMGGMLVPLNSTMIAVALPEIMQEFQLDLDTAGWLATAYLITMASFQLVAGKLGDQFGRRWFVLGGIIVFGLASLLAAMSPNLAILLLGRVLQAAAGAIFITNAIALIFDIMPEDRRGRELGWLSAIITLAAAIGPLLGGLLIELANWRAVFWSNVPIAFTALLIGWSAIPQIRPQPRHKSIKWLEIISLFKIKPFASANGAIFVSNMVMYVLLLATPLILSTRSGWTSRKTGSVMAVMSISMAVISPLGGRISDRYGRKLPSVMGLSLITLGLLPLSGNISEITAIPVLVICGGMTGIGLGLSGVSLQTAALEAVDPHQTGVSSGVYSTSRYLGGIVGSGILARMVNTSPIQVANFRFVFLIITLAAFSGTLMSWAIPGNIKRNAGRQKEPSH